jgi:hypothetical protein
MPLYFSAHTTACLTKQALRQLMEELLAAKEVNLRRCVASQIGGRMLIEAEAADQGKVEKFFEARWIPCEWIMRIGLDAKNGTVVEF